MPWSVDAWEAHYERVKDAQEQPEWHGFSNCVLCNVGWHLALAGIEEAQQESASPPAVRFSIPEWQDTEDQATWWPKKTRPSRTEDGRVRPPIGMRAWEDRWWRDKEMTR